MKFKAHYYDRGHVLTARILSPLFLFFSKNIYKHLVTLLRSPGPYPLDVVRPFYATRTQGRNRLPQGLGPRFHRATTILYSSRMCSSDNSRRWKCLVSVHSSTNIERIHGTGLSSNSRHVPLYSNTMVGTCAVRVSTSVQWLYNSSSSSVFQRVSLSEGASARQHSTILIVRSLLPSFRVFRGCVVRHSYRTSHRCRACAKAATDSSDSTSAAGNRSTRASQRILYLPW